MLPAGLAGKPAIVGPMRAFAGADPPDRWPRLRGAAHPERCDALPVDSLKGVGPGLAKRAPRSSASRPCGDLALAAPLAATSVRSPEKRDRRPVRRGRGRDRPRRPARSRSRRARGAAHDPRRRSSPTTPARSRRSGSTSPGSRGRLRTGTQVRLRGQLKEPRVPGARSTTSAIAEATADFAPLYPGHRVDLSAEAAARARRSSSLRPRRAVHDPLPAALRVARAAAAALRRALGAAPVRRRSRRRERAAGGWRSTSCSGPDRGRAAGASGSGGRATSSTGELIERFRAALPYPLTGPGARDRRDRKRPRAHADAPAAAGRRRLREDRGRALRAARAVSTGTRAR